jgi:hypothetical protein
MKSKLRKFFSLLIFFLSLSTLYSLLSTAVVEAGIIVVSTAGWTYTSTGTVGATWIPTPPATRLLPPPATVTYQDICRDALGHLYVLRSDGIVFRSTDTGKSWSQRNTSPPVVASNYDSIIVDTGTAGVLYLMRVGGEVYRSTDSAVTWPTAKARPTAGTYVGIAIGRTNPDDSTAKFNIVTDVGKIWRTSLDLSADWEQKAPAWDAGPSTDYTDLTGDRFISSVYGYLYLLDEDGMTSRKARGATEGYWYDLTLQPPVLDGQYVRFEQDLDIFATYPQHLYALRKGGGIVYSTGAAASSDPRETITPASFVFLSSAPAGVTYTGLSSYDALLPKVTDQQIGDDEFRNSSGTLYKVYFEDPEYGSLRRFETRVTDGSGMILDDWRIVVDTINASIYNSSWTLPVDTWLSLRESATNFVSVRIWDNSSSSATATDVFYVLKDTTPPTVPVSTAPADGAGFNYRTIFFDWTDSVDTRSGIKNYLLQISTDINFAVVNYSSSPVISQATMTVTDNLYYWRVRAEDKATNVSLLWSTTRYFVVDTSAPAVVADLSATQGNSAGEVKLTWYAPGDDGTSGTISTGTFKIQYSTWTGVAWSTAKAQISITTYNVISNTLVGHTTYLLDAYYYFCLWTADELNNWSGISNSTSSWAGPDISSPTWVTTVGITSATSTGLGSEIRVQWNGATDIRTPPVYYRVYKDTVGYFSWANDEIVYESSSPSVGIGYIYSYIATGLTDGTTYTFGIRARDSYGSGNIEQNTVTISDYPTDTTVPNNIVAFACIAISSGNQIDLSWGTSPSSDWTGTMIRYSTISAPSGPTAGILLISSPTSVLTYQHINLTDNVTYYYTVFAYDEVPNYASGISTSTYPRDTLAPGNVNNFTAVAVSSGNQIDLSWSASPSADWSGTMIRYKTTAPAPASPTDGNLLISSPTSVSIYQHLNLTDNVTYYYTAFAYDEVTNYAGGISTSTYPRDILAPENVILFTSSAQPQGNTILLSWSTATITADDFQGVRICSSTVEYPNNYNVGIVTDVVKSTTYYLNTNLVDKVTYYYRAWAYDEVRNYAVVIATTSTYPRDILPPDKVSNFSAAGGDGKVTLSWINIFDDQKGTRICSTTTLELLVSPTDYFLVDISTPGNTYEHAGLVNGVTYYYKSFAYDEVPNFASGTTAYAIPTAVADTLYVSSFAVTGVNVLQGSATNVAYVLVFTVDANTVTITGITVRENGTSEDNDVGKVRLIDDLDLSSSATTGDILLSTTSFVDGIATFVLTYPVSTATARHLIIAFDVSSQVVHGRTVQARLANQGDIIVQLPDTVAIFSDYKSNIFTIIDVSSPSNVTNFTAVAVSSGNQIDLSWTNVGGDQVETMIRYELTPPGPISYTDGILLISSPTTISTYQHLNLTDNVTYYYTAFARDSVPNYSTGTTASAYPRDIQVPANISPFTATAIENTIKLTWTNPADSDFAGVEVRYSSISALTTRFSGEQLLNWTTAANQVILGGTTNYYHLNLLTDLTYYYRAWTYDEVPNYATQISSVTLYLAETIAPNPVINLIAQPGSEQKTILLTWNYTGDDRNTGNINNGRYAIQYSTDSGTSWAISSAQIYNSTTVTQGLFVSYTVTGTITGLIEGATYFFRLWIADERPNWSGISNGATTWAQREAPENIYAFSPSPLAEGNKINLSWSTATITALDFQGVRICYSTESFTVITTTLNPVNIPKPTTFYLHTDLTDNVTYYYKAFSYDDAITPNYSTGISTSNYPRDMLSPGTITTLTVDLTWGTSVQLKWQATGDNGSQGSVIGGRYWVKWSSVTTVTNGNWDSIPYATEWSTDTAPGNWEVKIATGLQSDTTWYFALKLRDEPGAGNWSYVSNCATGTTRDITAPAKVENLFASTGPAPGQIFLTWSAPGDDVSSNTIVNGWFYIQHSVYPDESWNRESAQLKISTSNINPNDPQGYLVKEGLTPGVTYYFRLWTADEVPNWSTISNGATSYATIAPPAAALYPTTTTLTSPFPADSVGLSTSAPPGPASLNTNIEATTLNRYYQFKPEKLGSSPLTSLPSPTDLLFQSGWIYNVSQIYKTLFSGAWTIRVGWQASVPTDVRLCYRISKVTTTVSNKVELRENLTQGWREDTSTQTVKSLTYYSITVSASSSTFLAGEYLMVHLGIKLIGGGGSGKYFYLETNNTSNEYYTTPDWRDIIKPSTPTYLTAASSTTADVANLTWSAPGNNDTYGQASYYEIERAKALSFIPVDLKVTRAVSGPYGTSESTTSSGLSAGVTYYFRIRASDDAKPVENWSDWSAIASLTLYPHTFNVTNSAPVHRRMNESKIGQPKKDDLLMITLKNNHPSENIYFDSVRVRFTRDGSAAITTEEARNLFENIYLYSDTEIPDFYHYALDTSTVARKNKADVDFSLGDGELTIPTLDVPSRNLIPGETKKYFLVVELTTSAATVTQSTFAVSVTAVSKAVIRQITGNIAQPSTTTVSYPVVSSTVSVITPAGPPVNTSWPYGVGSKVQSVPVVYWNRVYFGAEDGKFYCLDSSGTTKYWEYNAGAAICDAPFWYDAESESERFLCFTDISGKVHKVHYTDGTAGASPQNISAAPGSWLGNNKALTHLYVGSTNSQVHKIRVSDLYDESPWPKNVGSGSLASTPVVNEWGESDPSFVNSIWIGSSDKNIYRLQSVDGTPQGNLGSPSITGEIRTSPYLIAGYEIRPELNTYLLYFTATDGKFYCREADFDPVSGWTDFAIAPSTPIYTNPFYTPYTWEPSTAVYFGADDGKLYKINALTGELIWSYPTDARIRSQIVLDPGGVDQNNPSATYGDEYVYFASDDGYIYCLTSGGILRSGWPVQTGAPIKSSPVIDTESGTLTIGSDEGKVYQIKIGE